MMPCSSCALGFFISSFSSCFRCRVRLFIWLFSCFLRCACIAMTLKTLAGLHIHIPGRLQACYCCQMSKRLVSRSVSAISQWWNPYLHSVPYTAARDSLLHKVWNLGFHIQNLLLSQCSRGGPPVGQWLLITKLSEDWFINQNTRLANYKES